MATIPIGGETALVTHPRAIPPAPAVMAILDRFNREELGHTIEVLVALLDIWDGDTEAEITEAEDDFADHGKRPWHGPGCEIADPGGCEHDGREEEPDMEREQMQGDVPMLPVFSLDYNLFTDQRVPLGIGNLQNSFVGQGIRSADTGAIHTGRALSLRSQPGEPV